VSSGAYSDSAGTFSKRDKVEYHSATHCEWLPATITSVDALGQILMDVKPNTWLSVEIQAEKVRPRQGEVAPPEPKGQKRPPTAAAPKSSRDARPADRPKPGHPLPNAARRRSDPGQRPAVPPPPEPTPRQAKAAPQGMRNQRPSSGAAGGAKYARSPRCIEPARLGA
jgi:hypothetical protein